MGNSGKSGEKWLIVVKKWGKVANSGEKLEKVGKSGKVAKNGKRGKKGKRGKSVERCGKVAISGEKWVERWGKVGKSGEKWGKVDTKLRSGHKWLQLSGFMRLNVVLCG